MKGIAMRASPGLFIRVSLSKDKVPEPNHYFIYYTCEVRVRKKWLAFGRMYPARSLAQRVSVIRPGDPYRCPRPFRDGIKKVEWEWARGVSALILK